MLTAIFLCLIGTQAWAFGAQPPFERANCTRSLTLLACSDSSGNGYSVATQGNTTYLQGVEAAGKRRWAQTNSRFGQLTFFTGMASDGEAWVGTIQRVGWTTITRVSSSKGTRSSISCGRLTGCHELKR
ncbi:glutamine synthetase [Pseudomonas sp. 3A(2025)]